MEKLVMLVEMGNEEKKNEGNTILVGIRLDGNGRDLLNWALERAAGPGDNVVAIHVCRRPGTCSKKNPDLREGRLLKNFLSVYGIFCVLKRVNITGRVYHEKSIQRVLVRESKALAAKALIVGVDNHCTIGDPTSLAKHCARKLPIVTAVLAVHNGKVIFQRDSTNEILGRKGTVGSSLRTLLHQSHHATHHGEAESNSTVTNLNDEDHKHTVQKQSDENSQSDITILVRKLPECKPGWPLLRRAASANVETVAESNARTMSVVQWAMNLPDRPLATSPLSRVGLKDSQNPFFGIELLQSFENGCRNFEGLVALLANRPSNCRWFTYHELQTCTHFFASDNLIGKGGSGRVYKGFLPVGKPIAIKLQKASQGVWRDFLLEVDILTSLQHEHVVPLIGICVKDNYLISVYTFISKGTLEENLHGEGDKCTLSWDTRYCIAVGIAEALHHLHAKHPRPVIHRDVKSSNILLSDEFKPMLCDFGLAMWEPTTSNYVTQFDVLGTFGYLAPEYVMYGKVSDKIDIYSFGVVLLELLSGRKAINRDSPKGKESLVMWATPLLRKGDVECLVDPNLDADIDETQLNRIARAASLCLRRAPQLRPKMNEILELFHGKVDEEGWLTRVENEENQYDELYPGFDFKTEWVEGDEGAISFSSIEHNNMNLVEVYMQDRWSSSSSFE